MKRQENFDGPSPIFHEAKFPYIFCPKLSNNIGKEDAE